MRFLSFFILVLLSVTSAFAENGYRFQSELEFKHDSSIIPGALENYSLYNNEDVKLLIGFAEKKSFLGEVQKLSDVDLKKELLSHSTLLDPINSQEDRSVIAFKVIRNNLVTKIEIDYQLLKNKKKWRESNVYVLSSSASTFAALQFPEELSSSEQAELKKGMHDFSLQDEKFVTVERESKLISAVKNTLQSLAIMSAKRLSEVLNVGSFLVSESFAAEAAQNKSCDTKKYIIEGDFSTKKGSALFNFQKLSNDLIEETKKENASPEQLTCLSQFFKKAKEDSVGYWTERGIKEGCLDNKGQQLSAKDKTCSDSTYKEMLSSFKYIDNVTANLDRALNTEEVAQALCDPKNAKPSEQMDAFAKLHASTQQAFCCSSGSDGAYDKGPLYSVLESENEDFKKLSPAAQAEMCFLKTKDDDRKVISSESALGCLKKAGEGVVAAIVSLAKGMWSLLDLETYKALGQFVANLPSSGADLVATIGQQIGAQLYSVTDCMSTYEATQHVCKIVPEVITTLLGPGKIKSFVQALTSKVGKTAVAQVVLAAAKESKQFKKIQSISESVSNSAKKIGGPVKKLKSVQASLAALAKVRSILGKDISTPMKEAVVRKAKTLGAGTVNKGKSLAEKVLKRSDSDLATLTGKISDDISAHSKALAAGDEVEAAAIKARIQENTKLLYSDKKPTATVKPVKEVEVAADPGPALELNGLPKGTGDIADLSGKISKDITNYNKAISAGEEAKAAALKARIQENTQQLYTTKKPPTVSVKPEKPVTPLTITVEPEVKLSANASKVIDDISDYKKALAVGEKNEVAAIKNRMMDNAKKLDNDERIAVAKEINGGKLKNSQKVIEAHEVGGPGRELGSYDQLEILQKARAAKKAGIGKSQRRDLLEAGVLGGDSAGAIPNYISLQTPSAGRISARVVSSTGDSHVIEYMARDGKTLLNKTLTTEDLKSLGMKAEPKPVADLNSVFDDIEREAKERVAVMQAAQQAPVPTPTPVAEVKVLSHSEPEHAPAPVADVKVLPHSEPVRAPASTAVVEPVKPTITTYPERVNLAQKPDYVNSYGVAKADLTEGRAVRVKVRTMNGVKEVEGELINGMHIDPATGMPSVQLKYADGVITEPGNVMRGKPDYKIENVHIDTIEELKPKVVLPEAKIEAVAKKPLPEVKQPVGKQIDPESFDGKTFRNQADVEAINSLLKEERIGGRFHIEELNKSLNKDNIVRGQATSRDTEVKFVSQDGRVSDPRFNPKIYYAHQAEEYYSAATSASKFSTDGIKVEIAEERLKGVFHYGADGKAVRKGSARDTVRDAMKKSGKTEDQIKEVEKWMDQYDETVPRKANVEKAKIAQAEFEKLKPKLETLLNGNRQILAKSTFEDMSRNLKDMMLSPEKKEAAQEILRKIKCSRPEWNIGDTHQGFNLKCH